MLKNIALLALVTTAFGTLVLGPSAGCTDLTDEKFCENKCSCEGRPGDNACLHDCNGKLGALKEKAHYAGCDDQYDKARICADTYFTCVADQWVQKQGTCTVETPALDSCIAKGPNAGGAGGAGGASTTASGTSATGG
jgi:hypothetical protein